MTSYVNAASFEQAFNQYCLRNKSHSQINQDLLPLFVLGNNPGYFVEIGAGDGNFISNTLLLEKDYGWHGILCEPVPKQVEKIRQTRSAIVEAACIYSTSLNKIEFLEVEGVEYLSGIKSLLSNDLLRSSMLGKAKAYLLETISLDDLLDKHNAPQEIDFLSIDTEGSEYNILQAYSFSRKFKIICVENNNNDMIMQSLLKEKGYTRVMIKKAEFDSWYIREDLYRSIVKDEVISK